ncbi:hypothetical protein CLU96_3306 [Chryseobacterium sp. 52]|uniref:hypothetical protein n=1 Tax=Chryseobacterium sp. 52 TaxID=2035213 RepID=UPI000C192A44|nr:hypothetical protein [Chryseobacterium sp. 52]PIF46281.1 hypothetical protein CLU96_3306 [Chryseobacterium sp. 52]
MKKIIYILLLVNLSNFVNGQIAIGKASINGNSTILDFEDSVGNTKGIILPAVDNVTNALATVTSDNNGTFLFDKSDSKIKMYQNNMWVNLSDAGNNTAIPANSSLEYASHQGIIMGAPSSGAKGVLVLESANKAMILPKIANPHSTVKNPYPGMMCYDITSKTLAVFDGTVWNYWN